MNDISKRIPRQLAVIHVNHTVIFPYMIFPLTVIDESLKKVVDYALNSEKLIGFFLQREESEETEEADLHAFGTAVTILRMLRNPDGSMNLLLQGVSRIRIERFIQREPFIMVEVEPVPERKTDSVKTNALKKISLELLEKVIDESSELSKDFIAGLRNVKPAGRVADIIASNISLLIEQKQEILETLHIWRRFEKLNGFLAYTIRQLKVENHIRNNIQLEMEEDQRRYYLHEQLEAIRKELGEVDEVDQEIAKWKRLLVEANPPEEVLNVAREELERLAVMTPASSEYSVVRNYLEWILSLPWEKTSTDRMNMKVIGEILAKDHFGLEKPKERVMEFLAVKKLKNTLKGPILCFVGPPGVGKTSIGKSIARAMNRKFIRVSLGGIHDEAEIRGHRRTYIGAMPGKILTEIKRCGTANPVFMLDEIDKVGRDFQGDPSSALLEVLDPEQNNRFTDNYINLPFDLSKVMFITTANTLETIPPALEDRMEVIEFSSYIEEEKIEIARKYLIPKELENNGLTGKNARFDISALQEIIRHYAREAGVRELQRCIGTILRKIARKVAEGKTGLVMIKAANVRDYLSIRKYIVDFANRKPEVGIATGLAWTPAGGEILFCETSLLKGKGKLMLTGLLGEVMQESAKIAMSVMRSRAGVYDLKPEDFENQDVHIHLPSGAVPKDGPSAGVTLFTSMCSAFVGRPVLQDWAMTGEITLRGKVLPVGGIREKVLAAKRAGIFKVIMPVENRDHLEEIDKLIVADMTFHFAETIDDVLDKVLLPAPESGEPTAE